MANNPKGTVSPSPFFLTLRAADHERLEVYASAFGTPPATVAAEVVNSILRSLPPPPKQPQTTFSGFLAAELNRTGETCAALWKAAGEADVAASRAAALIDLIEPALHRFRPPSS
jgi:hypothetical protein